MSDFNYQEYLKNNPLLKKEVKDQLITESQKEVQEYVETSGDPVGDDLKKLKAFVDKSGSKAKAAFKNFLDSIELGSMQKAMASEELEITEEEISEEVPSSKMKVSELKAKIKEDIISLLQEEEEDEVEVEDEIEDEVDVEMDDEISTDTPAPSMDAGLSKDEQDIQDSLKVAYDKAVAIGDEKLADQIGNSITFFTRSHVVER